jgi:2-polyprenyl-3-methyl-5-hydroxy-6-metoxy-1,4-benzoquinol methylase
MKRCPICNSSDLKLLSTKLRDGSENPVLVCENCETGFLDKILSQENLEEYYKESYRRDFKPNLQAQTNARELFDIYKQFQHDRLNLLAPYFNPNHRLLEIGCSAGMFLYHAKKHYKEVVGIELDRESAYFAENECNCQVLQVPINKTTFEPESFDVICAFQVLEHVTDPFDFLVQALKYLKKNGILYFEFPNRFDALVSAYDLPFHTQFFYHAAHNYYFSEKGISIILNKCNLEASFFYTQDYNILNHINWINNDQPQKNCIPGLSKPSLIFKKNVDANIKLKLSDFFQSIDMEYKNLLCQLKLSSNMAFIAKRIV